MYPKPHIVFNSNGLATRQGFLVITYIQVKSGRRSAILNLIKLKFPRQAYRYPHLKPHILFNSNGRAIWHSFPVITYIYIQVKSGYRSAILY